MTTESINKANAQHSTGPRTPEGKAKSSQNALKHGLTAATVILPGEDPAEFNAFLGDMLHDLKPLSSVEEALVLEMVDAQWRLRRGTRAEAKILSAETPDGLPDLKALNNLTLLMGRIKRLYSAALKEYNILHKASVELRFKQLEEAENVYFADRILNRPSTFAGLRFDFSLEYLEDFLLRKQNQDDAREIVSKYRYGTDEESLAKLDPKEAEKAAIFEALMKDFGMKPAA